MKWPAIVLVLAAGCGTDSGARLIELADGGASDGFVRVSPSGEAFAVAGDDLARVVDGRWVPLELDPDLGLPTGMGYAADGQVLVTTTFYTTPNTSALAALADDGSTTVLAPLASPGGMGRPAGLPSGHVYLQAGGTTYLWIDPATGWQPAPPHRSMVHADGAVLAMTDDGVVSIAGDDDVETLVAPCASFPEPCEQLGVAGADLDGRTYVFGYEDVLYTLAAGATVPEPIALPGPVSTATAGPGGLVATVSTARGTYGLITVRAGETEAVVVDTDCTLSFAPTATVTPGGSIYVWSESWLAEVVF